MLHHINYPYDKWAQDICKAEAIYHDIDRWHDCRLNISEAIYRDCHLGVCLLFYTLSHSHCYVHQLSSDCWNFREICVDVKLSSLEQKQFTFTEEKVKSSSSYANFKIAIFMEKGQFHSISSISQKIVLAQNVHK